MKNLSLGGDVNEDKTQLGTKIDAPSQGQSCLLHDSYDFALFFNVLKIKTQMTARLIAREILSVATTWLYKLSS